MFSNSRRHFMRASAGATLAALTGSEARLVAGPKIEPRADSVILLWMAGGKAQTETFDPKKYTPYETGLASDKVLRDRKSTRLNSSHANSSYAVFCLKK